MKYSALFIVTLLALILFTQPSQPLRLGTVDTQNVTVCPASDLHARPPSPINSICSSQTLWSVDPQNKHIWLFVNFEMRDQDINRPYPLGLGISAKAASKAFINGQFLGVNGEPSDRPENETSGQMDHMFNLQKGFVKTGVNTIALRLSAHRGYLNLDSPIHNIFVTDYVVPQDQFLRQYWLSLLPFGAFILGGIYFYMAAIRLPEQRIESALLSFMSAIIAIQLLVEVGRGLIGYAYPLQDLRLITILATATAFGITLTAYVARLFVSDYLWPTLGLTVSLCAIAILMADGLDTKTSLTLIIPTIASALAAIYGVWQNIKHAKIFSIALIAFAAINFSNQGRFLDLYFYYAVAGLLFFLFHQQISVYLEERNNRHEEQSRADKLQYILDDMEAERGKSTLSLSDAGQVRKIEFDTISVINSAGNYTEIIFTSGQKYLSNISMIQLENRLPSYFLRIHRSHIINTKLIIRLERAPSGTGQLYLKTGQIVQVSRRILPKVRDELK